MKKQSLKKKLSLGGIMIVAILTTFGIGMNYTFNSNSHISESGQPEYTEVDLSKYDGTNADLPIYIALNGDVYDVSEGRGFYEPGGTYHYLAGRDSSKELNMIGGTIIANKYPIVGVLTK
jgi:predicted heme/steroid binding protein